MIATAARNIGRVVGDELSSAVVPRLGRAAALWTWLPSIVVPPLLIVGCILSRGAGAITAGGVLAAIVGCLPLTLRRRLVPVLYAPILTAGIVLVIWQLNPGDVVVLIPVIALFEVAQGGDRRRSLWLAVISVPCVAISILPFGHHRDSLAAVSYNLLLCLLAIAGGDLVRTRQESGERAAAAREQLMLRRVGEERLQIAHEIHDVVAHAMTAINVQAGVAAHLLERDPAHAHQALREIKRTSGDALRDLRATLDVLRDPDQAAPLTVASGLDDLDGLAAGVRAAGVEVELDVTALGELAPGVHSAGYRIVQEALTNVVRHAGAQHAFVTVQRVDGAVRVEVRDDGRGPAPAGGAEPGNGLRGMRERAAALDGSVDAGPAPSGGWRVIAQLPAPETEPGPPPVVDTQGEPA